MGALDGVPLLLTAATAIAAKVEVQREKIQRAMQSSGSTSLVSGLRVSTAEMQVAAVGAFSLFEARMQPHFPQGSFFPQLKGRLDADGRSDIQEKIHQYYLAVNVLKHGDGASYRALLAMPKLPFTVKAVGDDFFNEGDVAEPEGLIDTSDDFFAGLLATLQETYDHLGPPP